MLRFSRPLRLADGLFERIFLINLDRRTDRLQQFRDELSRAAGAAALSAVERVPAVDGSRVELDALLRCGLLSPLGRRRLREPPHRRIWGMDLTPGAVGCALSHVSLWCRIAAAEGGGGPGRKMFLVLEDDCVFDGTANFSAALRRRLRHVPDDDWGLLYLGGLDTAGQCARLAVAAGVARVPQFHRTTSAYVVTPAGARALLRLCVPLTYQIDTMMTMEVRPGGGLSLPYVQQPPSYTLMPPIVTQRAATESDIQDDRPTD